ncbi:hypothetical protein FQN50_001026 [Emmonsiellopsis sp. PD_5]|nr:hypothetical protein FQN50_001026 [Emmonsiellopsis sp. PD_5]
MRSYLFPVLTLAAASTVLAENTQSFQPCNVNGVKGSCMPDLECESRSGISVAGDWCPDSTPDNWQCCVSELPPNIERPNQNINLGSELEQRELDDLEGKSYLEEPDIEDQDHYQGLEKRDLDEPDDDDDGDDGDDPDSDLDLGNSLEKRAAKRCSVHGTKGKCVKTSTCKGKGGVSTAGFCPGPANVQCCTPKKASCKAHGLKGTCVKTSACKSKGQVSTPGHCPGPKDVQCCTEKKKPEKPGKSCDVRGTKGTCMKKSACKAKRHISTPGFCSGADMECCTSKRPEDPKVTIPGYGCKGHVVSAGYEILKANPGTVKRVECLGPRAGKSEHRLGLALDLMVYKEQSKEGEVLAEWVMKHAKSLKVKDIIWNQRIWKTPSKPEDWSKWTKMDDRHTNTENTK